MQKTYNSEKTGDIIQELRKDKGLSQANLASELSKLCCKSIGQTKISGHESGERELYAQEIFALSQYFGVSADYLLGLSNEEAINADRDSVCRYTGLDATTVSLINRLHKMDNDKLLLYGNPIKLFLDFLFSNQAIDSFYQLLMRFTQLKERIKEFNDERKEFISKLIKSKNRDEIIAYYRENEKEQDDNYILSMQYEINSLFKEILDLYIKEEKEEYKKYSLFIQKLQSAYFNNIESILLEGLEEESMDSTELKKEKEHFKEMIFFDICAPQEAIYKWIYKENKDNK